MIAKVFTLCGFEPHQFSRVDEVEAALARVKPEVIVLDLSLGGSDAVEVMRSLEAARFSGSLILISGHGAITLAEVQTIGERHGLAMLPFLRKPFEIADLKQRLATARQRATQPSTSIDLLAALEGKWLELWYQPKIDLRTMRISGAEALVRMRHPERGILAPRQFLPPAGDALFTPLTDFVVRRSLSDWRLLAQAGLPIRLAINVPASSLQRADFVAGLRRHLPADAGFPGLMVEITEDEALSDPDLAWEAAVQLKLYGIHVSIDDFGTGYSTLGRLGQLPFAELKLDRRYVDGCAADGEKRDICRHVVELAHRSGIVAVAEGVETEPDLEVLRELDYDLAQGFLFARPMEIQKLAGIRQPVRAP